MRSGGMGLAQYARLAPAAAIHLSETSVCRVPSCPPVAVLSLCQTHSRRQSRWSSPNPAAGWA
eukprot:2929160-Heterocapsa_arctica.AAC.1